MNTPTVFLGDCLDVLKTLEAESVDSVVTDPPYHLTSVVERFGKAGSAPAQHGTDGAFARASRGFMGKEWDGGDVAFRVETWAEVMRVLKPGGHLAAFGGTRTAHRMACAIEDAGFEIRDSLMWIYGCLDDKTECLTGSGWKNYNDVTTADNIMQWDSATGELTWTRPAEKMVYPYSGPMVRLKNRHTDQSLTPNHRVYAKIRRHSRNPIPTRHEVVEAGALRRHWHVDLPMAGVLAGGIPVDLDYAYLVGWWLTDAWEHGDGKAAMFSQCKPITLAKLRAALARYYPSEYVKTPREPQHQAEHSFYVTGPIADRLRKYFPGRVLPASVLGWNEDSRRALLRGLLDGDGSVNREGQYGDVFWSQNAERRGIVCALGLSLGYRSYECPNNGAVYLNSAHDSTQIQSKHAQQVEHYVGDVWCLRVETGAFVVRRNGRPFITGNSGFPKSHDVSKGIDKAAGAVRAPDDYIPNLGNAVFGRGMGGGRTTRRGEPATPDAARWQGWGTALKPAHEPIVLARKPLSEKTVAANVLRHGCGAVNINASRISLPDGEQNPSTARRAGSISHLSTKSAAETEAEGKMASRQSPEAYRRDRPDESLGRWPANIVHDGSDEVLAAFPINAARFFYSAKASKADRAGSKHPTVKPLSLMTWLVNLITPPGGTVLDPFSGSGTTLQAARDAGFGSIGIERDPEYHADILRRLGITTEFDRLFG